MFAMPTDRPKHIVPDGDLAVATERKLQRARRYRVVFYNDDYTTKWFVVDVLTQFFQMTEATAIAFMMEVHETGRGVAGVYTRDIAETKVAEVMAYAKEYEMPLRLDVEPEDDGGDNGSDK
jgi:ATP-dependent Clp protease adaptor protein ClpS